jgi:hypothetical protein
LRSRFKRHFIAALRTAEVERIYPSDLDLFDVIEELDLWAGDAPPGSDGARRYTRSPSYSRPTAKRSAPVT